MSPTPHRRRNYLINKKFQLRYTAYLVLTLSIVSFASALSFSFGIWSLVLTEFSERSLEARLMTASRLAEYSMARTETVQAVRRLADMPGIDLLSARDREILRDIIKDNAFTLAWKVALLFLFIGMGTIFLTHKIAGPLFRLRKTFKEIAAGNLTVRVRLRQNDQLQDVLPDVNIMISELDRTLATCKTLSRDLVHACSTHATVPHDIATKVTALEHELKRYTTTSHG